MNNNFDKIHTTGLDASHVSASLGEPVTGTKNAAPGRTEYIVGIQTLEVGKSMDDMKAITISNEAQKLKLKTQSGEETEVMGQLVYNAEIEQHKFCHINFNTSGNVIQAISEELTSTLKYGASNLHSDFYLRISKSTEDQLTNSEGKTIKAFMINDDDFITFRLSFEQFIKEFAREKGASETVIPFGSVPGMLAESLKVGFCPNDDDKLKSTIQVN